MTLYDKKERKQQNSLNFSRLEMKLEGAQARKYKIDCLPEQCQKVDFKPFGHTDFEFCYFPVDLIRKKPSYLIKASNLLALGINDFKSLVGYKNFHKTYQNKLKRISLSFDVNQEFKRKISLFFKPGGVSNRQFTGSLTDSGEDKQQGNINAIQNGGFYDQ